MATDRVVRWQERKPAPEEVKFVLEDFFNGQAVIDWHGDRYYVTLPGACTHPLARISSLVSSEPAQERWLEVWEDKDRTCLDVITRQQDEFVNALAAGLIEVYRRYWSAKPE